jgi:hypothetical protein
MQEDFGYALVKLSSIVFRLLLLALNGTGFITVLGTYPQ